MRLINLDELEKETFNGKTAVMKMLSRYEKEHPIDRVTIRDDGEWNIVLERRKTDDNR